MAAEVVLRLYSHVGSAVYSKIDIKLIGACKYGASTISSNPKDLTEIIAKVLAN